MKRLLKSVFSQSKPFSQVIVVDDCSPVHLPDLLSSFPIVFHRMPENGGPAKARNHGIEMALKNGAELIFFTDHDCIMEPDWNYQMTEFMRSSSFGAVGGRTLSFGKTLFDYYHDLNGTLNGKWLLPDRKELWYMPSLNFGMRADVAEQFVFDERFPTAAGEDVDLCLRLRSKYKIGFCPKAKLYHDFGYSSTLTGLPRFIRLFKKYKSSSATLYEGHTVLLWDSSESIFEGNAYESHL